MDYHDKFNRTITQGYTSEDEQQRKGTEVNL